MCLMILASRSHPEYPLVVAANRDEFFRRGTAPAAFWPQQPALLAGRDLEMGGTWMGLTRSGRFAAITNFRDPAQTATAPRSRGELTLDYLLAAEGPESWLERLAPAASDYAGFNLLLGDGEGLWYATNSAGEGLTRRALEPGIYGLSNAQLDTPWPKVILGKQRLADALAAAPLDHDRLYPVTADRRLSDPAELRGLGLDQDMDRLLSAQFIIGAEHGYGTRSSTTLWLTADGDAHWRELTYNASGQTVGRSEETFRISAPVQGGQNTGL